MALPDIALSEIPESTKDFILASAFAGKAPADLIRQQLDKAASAAGFGLPLLASSPVPKDADKGGGQ